MYPLNIVLSSLLIRFKWIFPTKSQTCKSMLFIFSHLFALLYERQTLIKHKSYKDLRDNWIQALHFANDWAEAQGNKMNLPRAM